jgi:hypothetical protein
MDLPDLPLRPLVWLLRGLLWLAWEFLFETVGWWIGWCVCRTLSLGQFPRYGLQDEDVPWPMRLLVEVMGLAALTALLWALTGHWW